MKLLEHEAKALLHAHQLPLPRGQVVRTHTDAPLDTWPQVLKVQIPVGGRGRAGGVQVVASPAEFTATARRLLARPLLGHRVAALLAEERLEIARELYLALAVDRAASALVLLAHPDGGVDVEAAAGAGVAAGPSLLRLPLGVDAPPAAALVRRVAAHLGLPPADHDQLHGLIAGLWEAARTHDAVLVEVNPLVLTAAGRLVCADAKIELDDAAAFRHPDWDFADQPQSAQFVTLSPITLPPTEPTEPANAPAATIASIANGAGLAMATIDAIKAAGARPANFCDVGGGTNEAGLVRAFEAIAALPGVRAIVVNIFGGITRCDEVARAIITARATTTNLPPLFIRLVGTNAEAAHALLAEAGLPLLPTLDDCVSQAVDAVQGPRQRRPDQRRPARA